MSPENGPAYEPPTMLNTPEEHGSSYSRRIATIAVGVGLTCLAATTLASHNYAYAQEQPVPSGSAEASPSAYAEETASPEPVTPTETPSPSSVASPEPEPTPSVEYSWPTPAATVTPKPSPTPSPEAAKPPARRGKFDHKIEGADGTPRGATRFFVPYGEIKTVSYVGPGSWQTPSQMEMFARNYQQNGQLTVLLNYNGNSYGGVGAQIEKPATQKSDDAYITAVRQWVNANYLNGIPEGAIKPAQIIGGFSAGGWTAMLYVCQHGVDQKNQFDAVWTIGSSLQKDGFKGCRLKVQGLDRDEYKQVRMIYGGNDSTVPKNGGRSYNLRAVNSEKPAIIKPYQTTVKAFAYGAQPRPARGFDRNGNRMAAPGLHQNARIFGNQAVTTYTEEGVSHTITPTSIRLVSDFVTLVRGQSVSQQRRHR